jgi:hypothetical protein
MKLGAEPKRLTVLGVLLAVAGYFVYSNLASGPPGPPKSAPGAPARAVRPAGIEAVPLGGAPGPRAEARAAGRSSSSQEFKPTLRLRPAGQAADLSSMEATLRLDLLARLKEVQVRPGSRNLFEFSAAPLPPEPKVIPKPKPQTVPLPPPPPPVATAPARPAAPPIPLKFFGYTTPARQGNRRAFFLDGDQILVGSEGELLKKRYRVVRIGVNSVVMEDVEFQAEQTLPLEPQVG